MNRFHDFDFFVQKVLQETQLSLTNHATHLCKCNGVADFLKHTPPICVSVTMPNLAVLY